MILALTFSYGICKRWPASVQKRTRPSFFLCQLISLAILWRNKLKSAVGRIEVKLATGIFSWNSRNLDMSESTALDFSNTRPFLPKSILSTHVQLQFSHYFHHVSATKLNTTYKGGCGLFKVNLEFSFSFPGFSFSGLDLVFKPEIHFKVQFQF